MRTKHYLLTIATSLTIIVSGASCRKTYEPIGGIATPTDSDSSSAATPDTMSDKNADTGADTDTKPDTNFNRDSESDTEFPTDVPTDTIEDTSSAVAPDSDTATETTTDIEAEVPCISVGNGTRSFESNHYKLQVSVGRDSLRTTNSSTFRLSLGSCNP